MHHFLPKIGQSGEHSQTASRMGPTLAPPGNRTEAPGTSSKHAEASQLASQKRSVAIAPAIVSTSARLSHHNAISIFIVPLLRAFAW